jgi:repressor of nif and glnA expression
MGFWVIRALSGRTGILAVFRCLSFTAINSVATNKSKIASHEISGTVGVGDTVLVGDCVWFGEVEAELVGMVIVCVLLQSLVPIMSKLRVNQE